MYRDIPEELLRLIEPVVEDHGCELVDVESHLGSSRTGVLRVLIDRREGDGRVGIERCAEISREIETQLDAHDAVSGSYNLEVSSPGLDRVLAREKDFAAACGKEIRLRTRRPLDGRRQFKGSLIGFDGGTARLLVDGREFDIPFAEVEKANSIYQFTRADFARAEEASAEEARTEGARTEGAGPPKVHRADRSRGPGAKLRKSGARNR